MTEVESAVAVPLTVAQLDMIFRGLDSLLRTQGLNHAAPVVELALYLQNEAKKCASSPQA